MRDEGSIPSRPLIPMKMMSKADFAALIKSSPKHPLIRFNDGNVKDFKRDRLEKMDDGKYQVDESKYEITLHWRPSTNPALNRL